MVKWIVVVIVVLASSFYLYDTNKGVTYQKEAGKISPPREDQKKWNLLIERWNKSVRNNGFDSPYLLTYSELEGSSELLNRILKPVRLGIDDKINIELSKISKDSQNVFFLEYQKFMIDYYQPGTQKITIQQNFEQVRDFILKATKTQGIHKSETSRILLAMNSPCNYFKLYKKELHKKGMSKNFDSCLDLLIGVDKNAYPNILKSLQKKALLK